MAKIPKWPKGLRASVGKLERQLSKKQAAAKRKKEIEQLRTKKAQLQKKVRGY